MEDTGQKELVGKIYNSIFAPVLLDFVEWVLEEAQKQGIKRLYFLARDGYQMYLAAQQLCETRGLAVECRYLYGSRYAWRMPQFALIGEACLEKLCLGGIDVTFEKVMRRGGLTAEEAATVAKELGFEKDYRRILSYSEVQQLKKPLAESKYFLSYVYEHSENAYETTIRYLRQEGLFENIPYALVDSGWSGSMQQTLAELLQHTGNRKQIVGFYFGLYELPSGVNRENYHTFYFGPDYGMKQKVYFSNCLFEAVFSAPHGMTVGYEAYDDGAETPKYRPVFYNKHNLNQSRMEQEEVWLKESLENYTDADRTCCSKKERAEHTYSLLKRFMGSPTAEEAGCYGNLLFSDDVTEEQVQCVAAELRKEDIRNQYVWNRIAIMLGLKKQVLKDSAWIEGSVVMAKGCYLWQMANVRCYKYLIYFRKWLKRGR